MTREDAVPLTESPEATRAALVASPEVYALAWEVHRRLYPSEWRWSDLTAGEREQFQAPLGQVVRAVLEIQAEQGAPRV